MCLNTCKQINKYIKLSTQIDRKTVVKIYEKKVLECINNIIEYFGMLYF